MQNDETIRVSIRTPSSTNRIEEKKTGFFIPEPINYDTFIVYQMLNNPDEFPNYSELLNRSLYSDDIRKNSNIEIEFKRQRYKGKKEEICSICQETFRKNQETGILTNCSHFFHIDCIKEWGKYKQECPLCKTEIPYSN